LAGADRGADSSLLWVEVCDLAMGSGQTSDNAQPPGPRNGSCNAICSDFRPCA